MTVDNETSGCSRMYSNYMYISNVCVFGVGWQYSCGAVCRSYNDGNGCIRQVRSSVCDDPEPCDWRSLYGHVRYVSDSAEFSTTLKTNTNTRQPDNEHPSSICKCSAISRNHCGRWNLESSVCRYEFIPQSLYIRLLSILWAVTATVDRSELGGHKHW